jgi:PAS domain S-box-containing protein
MDRSAHWLEERFRRLLEAAPDAMVIVDRSGTIVHVNAEAERLFGYPREEIVGAAVEELIPERLRGTHPGHRERYFAEPRTRLMGQGGLDLYARRRDGSEFPAEISLSPMDTGEGLLAITAIRDISGRKEVERALVEAKAAADAANQELESFSYSVAHDLRAPLRSITGFSQILREDYADKLDARGQEYLRRVGAAAERMGSLIDALLELSRVSRAEVRRERVDLARIARNVVSNLREGQPDRQVEAVIGDVPPAMGDPQLLRALLENLVHNAWKFTSKRADARLELGAAAGEGGAPVYFVRDNGAGFDMAHAVNLFTPFQRLHPSAQFSGSGIGLATVARIVRRHGGRIWAEAAVSQGATFYFTLGAKGPGTGS